MSGRQPAPWTPRRLAGCLLAAAAGFGFLCLGGYAALFFLNGRLPGLDLPETWFPPFQVSATGTPAAAVVTVPPTDTLLPPLETSSPTLSPTPSPSPTASPTASRTPTRTASPTATQSPTPSPSPTEAPLVVAAKSQAFCRYGPSTAFLPNVDIFLGDTMVVSGRFQYGGWLWVHPDKVERSCWIAASLVEPPVDLSTLPIVDYRVIMPFSDAIAPPEDVFASRNGNQVTISWNPIAVAPENGRGYLIDAWVCQGGAYIKFITSTQSTSIVITDEPNTCAGPSGGSLFGAHALGYTSEVVINWP